MSHVMPTPARIAGLAAAAALAGCAAHAAAAHGARPPVATAAATPAPCAHHQLRASLGRGNGAAGHVFWPIVFTNTSATACTLRGYPGVSAVAGDDGHQVGAPARREPRTVTTVTLHAQGGTASALLNHTDADIPAPALCHKATVRGFRVYAPGQRLAFYLPKRHTTCRLPRFGDTIRPVVRGRTGQ
jgi:hypothetical protein